MGPIATLFPPDGRVAAAEVFGSTTELLPLVEALSEAERATLERSVESRRADYAAARSCARAALGRLGLPPVPVLNRADRSPIWPAGVVGSITHTRGYAAAAVARADHFAAVGIDAEPDAPLPDGVERKVLVDAERAALRELPAGPSWDRLVFCAKEATYKVWHPIMGTWLGFEDASVTLDPDGTFAVTLLAGPVVVAGVPLSRLTGHWSAASGLLGCALMVSATEVANT